MLLDCALFVLALCTRNRLFLLNFVAGKWRDPDLDYLLNYLPVIYGEVVTPTDHWTWEKTQRRFARVECPENISLIFTKKERKKLLEKKSPNEFPLEQMSKASGTLKMCYT